MNILYVCIHIAGSWWGVANDLKTHPRREDVFVKKRLIGADMRRCISRRKRILKTHWEAQTHFEDASGGADALRRHTG